jgi:hypothetical protein
MLARSPIGSSIMKIGSWINAFHHLLTMRWYATSRSILENIGRTRHEVKDLTNQWQSHPILQCDLVQGSIVHTQPQASVLLWIEEDWRASSVGGVA